MRSLFAYAIYFSGSTEALKALVLSDLHLNLLYNERGISTNNCFTSELQKP